MAGASAPAALAAQFGGFSVRPLQFDPNDPATRAYFKPVVAPGHGFTGDVVVSNLDAGTIQLFVYPVDGLTGVTSGTVYADHADSLRKAGRWLTPAVHEITLSPHQQQTVAFTVSVPTGTVPGDHLAGIAFESAHPKRTTRGHFAVIQILRVVVGVQIRVPGPGAPRLGLTGAALKALPGTPVGSVVIDLANRGRLLCKPLLSVALNSGAHSKVVSRQLRTVLPGDAIPYPFAWPKAIAPGRYVVHVAATGCGAPAAWSGNASTGVRLIGAGHPYTLTRLPAPGGVQVWMLALIGVGGLLAGVVVAGGVYAIRRRRFPMP